MRSITFLALMGLLLTSARGQECSCEGRSPANFVMGYAGPAPEQLYPFDRQDPWLHGQHQRPPSYGGYSSFRPYNYRHVMQQSHFAAQFNATPDVHYSSAARNHDRSNRPTSSQHTQNAAVPSLQLNQPPVIGRMLVPVGVMRPAALRR